MGQAPVSEVLSITSLAFTALLQMKEADEHNYAGLVWCVGKKKTKICRSLFENRSIKHVCAYRRHQPRVCRKKDSMVSASLMKKKEKNIAREKNAAQSISRPFKWVNNSSLIFFGKISHTYSQLDVEKTIEMDD